jgi:hypothetical protein
VVVLAVIVVDMCEGMGERKAFKEEIATNG